MPSRFPLGPRLAPGLAAALLGLQVLAASRLLCTPDALAPHLSVHVACGSRAWPFLDYTMFERGHALGETLVRTSAVLVLDDGSELLLRTDSPPRHPRAQELVGALLARDCARAWRIAHDLARERDQGGVALFLQEETLRLERGGLRLESTRRDGCEGP